MSFPSGCGQVAGMKNGKKKKSLTIPMQGFLIKLTTYKAEN